MPLLSKPMLIFVLESLGTTELIVILFYATIFIIPLWRICQKAGHPGWYSLVVFIPLLNIIALYLLAFTKWPIEREKETLRRM